VTTSTPPARYAKLFAIAALAQAAAVAVFIGVIELYKTANPGKEAWPSLLIALVLAFAGEVLFLHLMLSWKAVVAQPSAAARPMRCSVGVVLSWLVGSATFGIFDSIILTRAPAIAFVASALALFLILSRNTRVKASVSQA
jgi:hypothetical protein